MFPFYKARGENEQVENNEILWPVCIFLWLRRVVLEADKRQEKEVSFSSAVDHGARLFLLVSSLGGCIKWALDQYTWFRGLILRLKYI